MTTIELTETQIKKLRSLAAKTGRSESQLTSEAVNKYIGELKDREAKQKRSHEALMSSAGGWKDREDLSIFEEIRNEPSRFPDWMDRD